MSLIGVAGQHNGTALFALGAAWLVAGITAADKKALRTTLAIVAVAGAVFTTSAFWELLNTGARPDQGAAAGIFENSISLGEVLALSAAAALVWGLTSRSTALKWTSWGVGAYCLVGISFASSRTAFLGLIAAALYTIAIMWLPRFRKRALVVAASGSGIVIALTAGLLAASEGTLGEVVRDIAGVVGTGRDVIWRSALAQYKQSPLTGSGLEQFSAWANWSVAGDTFQAHVTGDPHSIVIATALGGGLIGLTLAAAATTTLLWALASAAEDTKTPWSVSILVALPVVALGCGLVGWIAPAAMLATSAIAGATLGGVAEGAHRSASVPPSRSASKRMNTVSESVSVPVDAASSCALVATYLVGVFALTLGVYGLAALPAERTFAPLALNPLAAGGGAKAAALYQQWPDPTFATRALTVLTPAVTNGDADSAKIVEALLASSAADGSWRADLAAGQLLAIQAIQAPGLPAFQRFEQAAARGKHAEPVSGLWDTLTAQQAKLLGLPRQSRIYAERALTFPLEAETSDAMRRLAAE